jgi:hypothetical protein
MPGHPTRLLFRLGAQYTRPGVPLTVRRASLVAADLMNGFFPRELATHPLQLTIWEPAKGISGRSYQIPPYPYTNTSDTDETDV